MGVLGAPSEQDLLKFVPHPKRCLANEFDTKIEAQCPNPREASYSAWFPWPDILPEQGIKVGICALHATYRENGGVHLGPILLRAGAEILQKEKRAKAPSQTRSSSRRSRSSSSS